MSLLIFLGLVAPMQADESSNLMQNQCQYLVYDNGSNNYQRIKIKEHLGIDDWDVVGKPYVQLHATVGSKLLIETK